MESSITEERLERDADIMTETEDTEEEEEDEEETRERKANKVESDSAEPNRHLVCQKVWEPNIYYSTVGKETHYFAGHEIVIWESLDSYGAAIWPAALALCRFLETNRQTVDLLDKAVLELSAGTGVVSIVASLLGAWVTATDLTEGLSNLRSNLSRNTRGRCRYTPQVAALSWGRDLEQTFPHSIYHYDYILAADVVYHHDFLDELLVTMCHFCQPGTTLIWANKVRFGSDLVFTERFKKAFHTTLLAEMEEVKIYMATAQEEEEETQQAEDEEVTGDKQGQEEEEEGVCGDRKEEEEQEEADNEEEDEEDGDHEELQSSAGSAVAATSQEIHTSESDISETNGQQVYQRAWAPSIYYRPDKDIHCFVGHEITIREAIDSYGGVTWPAALALCQFLDSSTGQQQVNLLDKSVLEIGAGTGLVSVVATLLGARVTATDLPEVLGNLQSNLNQNTRGRWRHTPQVEALSWGHDLANTFPHSICRYDYVLAADVVYLHKFLDELFVTMCHFCQLGTTLIWANKVRFGSDLVFTERFKKAFHTTLLAEMEEVKIYMATAQEEEEETQQAEDEEVTGDKQGQSTRPRRGGTGFSNCRS